MLPENFRDTIMRLPAVSFSLFFVYMELAGLRTWLGAHPYWGGDVDFAVALFARIALILFLVVLAVLHLTRRRPVKKHLEWRPKIEALLGLLFFYLLLLLPRAEPDAYWDTASAVLIVIGNMLAVLAVLDLGRSLSVMPEARKLVTEGIYSIVRHPLYLSEAVAMFGMFLQFRSVTALVIVLIEYFWQIRRMGWEERILEQAFPEYEAYRRGTARLIPKVY
jgi:protein-S-isoprenylcysteine O-methyltransferase Ste14